jgi:flagellar export protein FliJ
VEAALAAAFRFRFQRILEIKEQQQHSLEIEIANMDRDLRRREAEQERWQRTKCEVLQNLREASRNCDLELRARNAAFLPHVRGRIDRCRREVTELREVKEGVRKRLEQVMQSCKMLQKYRDRLKAQFLSKLEKAEEQNLDSHSMRKFIQAEGIT